MPRKLINSCNIHDENRVINFTALEGAFRKPSIDLPMDKNCAELEEVMNIKKNTSVENYI